MSLPAPTNPLKSLLSLIGAALLLVALAAACASPTPTPTPTATPEPTATPTPAPTPTPTPDAMMLAPDDGGVAARDLLSMLSADEESCVRAAVGDAAYDQLLESPASAVAGPEFPFDCISDERFGEISVAALSQVVGGLSSESEACLRALYAGAGDSAQQFPVGLSNDPESIAFAIRFILCVTDEEAESFSNQPGGDVAGDISDFFAPSDLRCIADEVGADEFIAVFVGLTEGFTSGQAQASPELMQGLTRVAAASQSCGVDPIQGFGGAGGALPPGASPFGADSGDRGSFEQVKAIWLELDPETQTLIDCLEAAASADELDRAFITGAFTPAVADCMERHADLVPQFTPDGAGATGQ